MRSIDADALENRFQALLAHIYEKGDNDAALLTVMQLVKSAPTIGGWISVKDRIPKAEETVLAVKQLKNGRLEMCLALCIPDWEYKDFVTGTTERKPYWVCGGNNNIIFWMPLPEMPEV